MILLFLINQLLACEFDLIYGEQHIESEESKESEERKEVSYVIPQADFTALGIWTRYYGIYLDIRVKKEQYRYNGRQFYAYQIISASINEDEKKLYYFLIIEKENLSHFFILNDQQHQEFKLPQSEQYEGVWIFTYIGFDKINQEINLILLNTKTAKFQQQLQNYAVNSINSINLFGQDKNKFKFSGEIKFSYSQSQQVQFTDGEQLVTYLNSCHSNNDCQQGGIKRLSNFLDANYLYHDSFEQKYTIQNSFWIDGWFYFKPDQVIQTYNNLILQIVQQEKILFNYNGIIHLQISLNYDKFNLSNNGIIVETYSYQKPIWNDSKLNHIKLLIFNESQNNLVNSWVYFRFLQYDQSDSTAEFYVSFSDSIYVNKNMGKLNLFKYGNFVIFNGHSPLSNNIFKGYLVNFNIQSCLQSYPLAKRTCHHTCLKCKGPLDNHCLSCIDEDKNNRIFNQIINTCICKPGYGQTQRYLECVAFEKIYNSTLIQFQINQSEIQPCKAGQFQYFNGEVIKCYDCPQQSSKGFQCANCLENSITWQNEMSCDYGYYQYDDDKSNTFILNYKQWSQDYYYIQDDQVLLCEGCHFSKPRRKKIINNQIILYLDCYQGYYYKNSSCYHCQKNCQKCIDITGECYDCLSSFYLQNQTCKSCPENCLRCDYVQCSNCLKGFTPGNGLCLECDTNCLSCEFDTNIGRTKCLKCKYSGYFLPFDGIDCVENTIQNCLIQYQQQIQFLKDIEKINPSEIDFDTQINFNIKTSLGFERIEDHQRTILKQMTINICALCEPKYLNFEKYCQYDDKIQKDEQILIKNICDGFCYGIIGYNNDNTPILGDKEIINTEQIYLVSTSNPQKLVTNCQVDFCIQCLKVQDISKCVKCSEGYYENIFIGQCIPCLNNCQTCQLEKNDSLENWKSTIRAYYIYQYQWDYVWWSDQKIESKNYEIICLTCLKGYMLINNKCVLECPTNCKKCSIIDGENICTFCGSNNYDRMLTIYKNECLNCPNNCELCSPRSIDQIKKINSLFNPDDQSKYYYSYLCLKPRADYKLIYNQYLQQYIDCKEGKFCMSQLTIKMNLHCDSDSFDHEKSKYTNFNDFYIKNGRMYTDNEFNVFKDTDIQSPEFIEYLKANHIVSLIYEYTLMSSHDYCFMFDFVTKAQRNVFSLQKTKLILNLSNLTLVPENNKFSIYNFSEVEINQFKIDDPFPFNFIIYHPNELIVRFNDINIIYQQENQINIMIINPLKIEINNFYLQTIQYEQNYSNNIISYQYTNPSTSNSLIISIDNLHLSKSEFYQSDFLTLQAGSNIVTFMINISNSVIESSFCYSSFIREQLTINKGSVNLNNVTFKVNVQQSSLINLKGHFNFSGSFNLIGNFISSNFIRTNQLIIMNSHIYNTTLYYSTLIDNEVQMQINQIVIHLIDNLKFESISFDGLSNFITLIDKSKLQDSLLIQNIQIIDCSFTKNKYPEGFFFQLLNSYFQKSILGLTDISIKYCKSAIIDNVTVVGTNIQGLYMGLDCYEKLFHISLQNGFIQMGNIQSIQLSNSQFNNLMVQNYPIIGIVSVDRISVTNLSFKNNLILKTESSSQVSIFQLKSTYAGSFSSNNISFIDNILHQYYKNQFQNSATTFLIEADQFKMTLNNTIFSKNQIFNSSDSMLYLKAKIIIIQNSIFTKSNVYDDFILSFIIWGSQSDNFYQENFSEIFPTLSVGGNAKFVAEQLLISFCSFSQSIAQSGSGFHLTLQNQLSISDTQFANLGNKLDKDDSYGGSIYINLISLNATIEIKNSNFINSSSLYDGGAIYINSRYTTSNITLSSIRVQNCYSFKGTFISSYLNQYSRIKITNITVKNSKQGFRNFLGKLKDLNDNQVKQFHLNSAIFYIQSGSLYLSDSTVSDIELSCLLYFYQASNLYIRDSVFQMIQFSSLGLIQVYPIKNYNTVIFIYNAQIISCKNIQPQQIICETEVIKYSNDFSCDDNHNKPKSLISYPQNPQAKENCFYNKLLDFTSSSNIIYVDLVQNKDYLYITDLNMRNNNCSLCKDGMIRIKNVDISTPEFNNIILLQLQFGNNDCGSGCLIISQQSDINYPLRRFLQNQLYQNRLNIQITVRLEQSEFFNNTAINGIIIVSDLGLQLINDKFIKNNGIQLSGGILFLGSQNYNFQIMSSEISESIGNLGGAFYLGNKTFFSTESLQILLSSNQAKSFGQDFVGNPQQLTVSLDFNMTLLRTKQITKTPRIIQEIQRKINFQTYDDVQFDEFVQKLQFNTSSQNYYLDDLIINFDPYLSYEYVLQLQFVCSSIQIPIIDDSSPYNIIGFSNNYELRMNIRTFKCQIGESYNPQLGTCNLCDASQSYYSVTIKAQKCSLQDDISMKSVKSTLIELRENYWRPYDDNNIVMNCYNFPVNCQGGWIPGDESCALGHIGALCEQCDLYNIRGSGSFARGGQYNCNSCQDLQFNTLQVFLITIWTLLSILFSVKGNVDNVDEFVSRMKGIRAGFLSIYIEKVKISVLFKILTNYLQIISSIATFQLKLSQGVKNIITFSGTPIKSVMYALDCFLTKLSNMQILYFRNIWFIILPIYYAIIIFTMYFLLIKIKYLNYQITVMSTTLIFIFIYVQPDIIGSFVSLLSYRNISQVLWVQGNVSYLYLTSTHLRWLLSFVVPILLLFGLLIPIFLFLKIFQNRNKLNDTFVLRIYGYLYNEYSKKAYYWENIKIFQKLILIIFLTFYEDTIIIKGTIVFMIIFCYDVFSKIYKPYKRVDLNDLDSQSSNVCGFSIVLAMAIYFADWNGNTEILWLFYLFMGMFNFQFMLRLMKLLKLVYLDKFTVQLDQLRDYINIKYPNILVNYPLIKKHLENSKIKSNRIKQRFLKIRAYLWSKAGEIIRNKKLDAALIKQIKQINQKEFKLDSDNLILRTDSNYSVLQSLADQRHNSIILSYGNDQEKINISLDTQMLDNKQALYQQQQLEQFNQDEQEKQNRDQYETLSMDFDKDQNEINKQIEEQLDLSQQE